MKRLVAKIVKLICKIAAFFGLLFTIGGAIGKFAQDDELGVGLIPGIVFLVVALVIHKVADGVDEKGKVAKLSKCKKCGKPMAGCRCEFRYDTLGDGSPKTHRHNAYDSLDYVTVFFTAKCPHCGHDRLTNEDFPVVVIGNSADKQQEEVDRQAQDYIAKYFGGAGE